jgi:signal peptidase II
MNNYFDFHIDRHIWWHTLFIAIWFGLDHWTKYLAATFLDRFVPMTIIPGFFDLDLAFNDGAAWSIFASQRVLLILISSVTIVVLSYLYLRKKNLLTRWSFVIIIAGAFGNLFDRVATGLVVDFLQFYPFGYAYPTFNVADIGIVVGTGLLLLALYMQELREKKEQKSNGK